MTCLISAKDISVTYTGKEILDIQELELYEYDRIGLVGSNGAGKSTLLKVLLGELSLAGCTISRFGNFSYIPQLEATGKQELTDYALLGRLGVSNLDPQSKSGGEETRLKVAKALSDQVHGVFADEPTCHLDWAGIDFLIGQFQTFSGALLIISHDRYFLDQVVDKIWELKDGKITVYWGNYSDYLRQKEEEHRNQAARYEQFLAERDRLERAAEEKRRQARKVEQKTKSAGKKGMTESGGRLSHQKSTGSKQKALYNAAKSMEHRIEAMGNIQAPERNRTIRFRQSQALTLNHPYPITGYEISKSFGEKLLFHQASFQIPLGAKVGFTGGNGTGKTTLLRMILNRETGISVSPKAEIGHFSQDGYQFLHDQEVLSFMAENSDYHQSEIRAVLASLGFSQNSIQKRVSMLSGGERIKLLLAKMLLGRYNILLMDEPSNFLDLPSVEALEMLMKSYGGTILFVSHDRRLLENVADRIYTFQDQTLQLTWSKE